MIDDWKPLDTFEEDSFVTFDRALDKAVTRYWRARFGIPESGKVLLVGTR